MKRKICNILIVLAMASALFFAILSQGDRHAEKKKEASSSDEDCVSKESEISEVEMLWETEASKLEVSEEKIVEAEETGTEALETKMPMSETEQIKKLQGEGIENKPEELPVWEGSYDFHEICPPIDPDGLYVGMDYDIEIYPDGQGRYCADVRIEGYQTCYLFRANVYGDSREIHLYFKESLFENREWGWPIKTVNQVQEEEKKPRRRGGDSQSIQCAVNLDEEIMSFVRDENGGGIYTTLGQLEGSELLIVNLEAGGIYLEKVE